MKVKLSIFTRLNYLKANIIEKNQLFDKTSQFKYFQSCQLFQGT